MAMIEGRERDSGLPQITNLHLKDEAYRVIKEAITSLKFQPGDPIMEGKLAKNLGISKTPVRNALVRLEQEGLVQTIPFRGTFVSLLTVRDVREIYEVRGALEELAIRKLAERVSSVDLQRLRAAIDASAVQLHGGHLEQSLESIREFHEGLVQLSDNHWLIDMYASLADHLTRIRNICGHIPGRVEKDAPQHMAIVDAIERPDLEAAVGALRTHLDSLATDYLRAVEKKHASLGDA
jgi:DNA-binding GntR family transcriptional regulator